MKNQIETLTKNWQSMNRVSLQNWFLQQPEL